MLYGTFVRDVCKDMDIGNWMRIVAGESCMIEDRSDGLLMSGI